MTEIIGIKTAEPAQIKCHLPAAFLKRALWSKESMPDSYWMNIKSGKQMRKIRRSIGGLLFFCLHPESILIQINKIRFLDQISLSDFFIRSGQIDQPGLLCFAFSCFFNCRHFFWSADCQSIGPLRLIVLIFGPFSFESSKMATDFPEGKPVVRHRSARRRWGWGIAASKIFENRSIMVRWWQRLEKQIEM